MLTSISCSKCGKRIRNVVGVHLVSDLYYYIKLQRFRHFSVALDLKDQLERGKFIGFYCQFCGKSFSKTEEKEIFKWLEQRKILDKLKA